MWKKNIRLRGWDYRNAGWYFITITCMDWAHYFGHIKKGIMCLNNVGTKAWEYWFKIPKYNPNLVLDAFVVMPNHVRGIVGITPEHEITAKRPGSKGDRLYYQVDYDKLLRKPKPEPNYKRKKGQVESQSLSMIINGYKGAVTRYCNSNDYSFKWTSRFYDHIIRNERAFENIRNYIINNPAKWGEDRFRK